MRIYTTTLIAAACLTVISLTPEPGAAQRSRESDFRARPALTGPLEVRHVNQDKSVRVAGISGVRNVQALGERYSRFGNEATWVVTAVSYRERNNIPCYIDVEFQTLSVNANGSNTLSYSEGAAHNWCGVSYPSLLDNQHRGDAIRFFSGLPNQYDDGTGTVNVVTRLEACLRSSNDRLKGVRLGSRQLSETGLSSTTADGLGGVGGGKSSPNCNDNWRAPSTCPSGRIATGVRISHGPVSGVGGGSDLLGDLLGDLLRDPVRSQVTGLALICSRVELAPRLVRP